ncbi:MAG: hypothetical protein M1823_000359 [Watsoniomyces obsoletus]|nr:MAG: hypothetical protein M1823_000359 [Watsoniomyces obsoletus]
MSLRPPFRDATSALKKVKIAQALWNTRDAAKVAQAYHPQCIWRNRDQFLTGQDAIQSFLTQKWERERNYRLRKDLFAYMDNRIAVQFFYEFQDADDSMKWKRCYGLENWTFADDGVMTKRMMSGNDVLISEESRWFKDGVDVDSVIIGDEHL